MKGTIRFCVLFLAVVIFLACTRAQTPSAGSTVPSKTISKATEPAVFDPTAQRLKFSASFTTDSTNYSQEDLGGNYGGLRYQCIQNVMLELSNEAIRLEEAIRDGRITVDELIAKARLDARNGYCVESFQSENGLAWLTYTYGRTCEINYLYDVYESPNGEQHLCQVLEITTPGYFRPNNYFFYDEETGEPYSLEDWGVEFEVTGYADGKVTIACTQFGGQQIGALFTDGYVIATADSGFVKAKPGRDIASKHGTPTELVRNTTTELVLDLNEDYDPLPSGTYYLTLFIKDVYAPEDVHPLMRNYRDNMHYGIEFVVP